jgi:hypothetical protein
MHKPLASNMTDEEMIEAIKNETPAGEQYLIDIARELGFEKVELFNGEVIKL